MGMVFIGIILSWMRRTIRAGYYKSEFFMNGFAYIDVCLISEKKYPIRLCLPYSSHIPGTFEISSLRGLSIV